MFNGDRLKLQKSKRERGDSEEREESYFSNAHVIEFEDILGISLEGILVPLWFDQGMFDDLVLVTVERDENACVSTCILL